MITCPKCNKELADDAIVCDACGAQIVETVFCPNCGQSTSAEFPFCQNCGAAIAEGAAPAKAKGSKKGLLFAAVGVIAAAVVAAALFLLPGGGKGADIPMFVKDGDLFYNTSAKKNGAVELSSKLFENKPENEAQYTFNNSHSISSKIATSQDGKRIFFPQNINGSKFDLYYRNANKSKADAEKLASDVTKYVINEKGNLVIYLTSEGKLYSHNLKDKSSIAKDVDGFAVTEDFKRIAYSKAGDDDTQDFYVATIGKDPVKVASSVSNVEYYSDDLSKFYYTNEDGDLYWATFNGKEANKDKIASEVSDVYGISNVDKVGGFYYTEGETVEFDTEDYVDEDYEYFDYMSETFEETIYTLYFYDGKKAHEVSKDVVSLSASASEKAAVVFSVLSEDIEKDEDGNYYSAFYNSATDKVAFGTKAKDLKLKGEEPGWFRMNKDATTLYYLADIETDEETSVTTGVLYQVSLKGDKPGEAKKVDSDVYSGFRIDEGKLLYFKDYDNESESGTLYIDGKKKADDVYVYDYGYTEDGVLYYFKDCDFEKMEYYSNFEKGDFYINDKKVGSDVCSWFMTEEDEIYFIADYKYNDEKGFATYTLYKMNGKKAVKIAEDVSDYNITEDGRVFVLTEMSKKFKGTLSVYKSGKLNKLDEDVSALIYPGANNSEGIIKKDKD